MLPIRTFRYFGMAWLATLLLLLGSVQAAQATHIVGGEIEMRHLEGERYRMRLILYFDDIYGNPFAEDDQVLITIVSKSTFQSVNALTLIKVDNSLVPYTNTACVIPQLRTRRIVYETTTTFPPEQYDDALGYYAYWERCCRNFVVNNLINPGGTGQTFLLEFPAVVRDGEPFINSTPEVFPPLADYACVNQPFFFDFGGQDVDGDSLGYRIITPLDGGSNQANGGFQYVGVQFVPGLSGTNPIPAMAGKELRIRPDGLLTITPSQAGLFVFAVVIFEFRGGRLIGQVRRDFQMLVRDDCATAVAPVVSALTPAGLPYVEGDTLRLAVGDARCFPLYVTDQDTDEPIQLEVSPDGFTVAGGLGVQVSPTTGFLAGPADSLIAEVCLPSCAYTAGQVFTLNFVAFDDACARPLTDTLKMTIELEEPPNQAPLASVDVLDDTLLAVFDSTLSFQVLGEDPDGDTLRLTLLDPPFDFARVGMQFDPATGIGTVESPYGWTLDCSIVRLGTQDVYTLSFLVEDQDYCDRPSADTVSRVIRVLPIANAAPELRVQALTDNIEETEEGYRIPISEAVRWSVGATDANGDTLRLRLANAEAPGLINFGWAFEAQKGVGAVSGPLDWVGQCDFIAPGRPQVGPFTLTFVVEDDFCIFPTADTLRMQVVAADAETPNPDFKVPTIFTPNGDAYNATFSIPNLPQDYCFGTFQEVAIFDRWGQEVFRSADRNFAWAGVGRPEGVYFWQVRYTSGERFKGTVMLYR